MWRQKKTKVSSFLLFYYLFIFYFIPKTSYSFCENVVKAKVFWEWWRNFQNSCLGTIFWRNSAEVLNKKRFILLLYDFVSSKIKSALTLCLHEGSVWLQACYKAYWQAVNLGRGFIIHYGRLYVTSLCHLIQFYRLSLNITF